MSNPRQMQRSVGSMLGEFRSKWGWFAALGIGLFVLGAVALANLALATVVSVIYVGALMLVGGIAQIVHAFQVKNWSGFLYWILSGLLYAAAGLIAFYNPLFAAAALTLTLAVALVIAGILRLWAGIQFRSGAGWGWIVASAVVTLLTGLVIAVGWPVNSLWILGLLLAIDLTFQGIMSILFGLGLKQVA